MKELLMEIEELGELQFSIKEIEVIIGRKIDNDEKKTAYKRGKLKAEAEVRKSIYQQAKQGSTPAQKQYMEIIQKTDIQSKREELSKTNESKKRRAKNGN